MMNTSCSITKTYVFKKLNIVRWKPAASNFTKADIFVAGSWDDEENTVSVWRCGEEGEPTLLQELPHQGDVTDMTYLSRDVVGASSSTGSVSLYQHATGPDAPLCLSQTWERCHALPSGSTASCTGLATNGSILASVGEDARLLLLNPGDAAPYRVIESGSDSSEYAVGFVKSSEVLTGSMQGQLRLWDIRKGGNTPVTTMITSQQEWVRRVCGHPSQQHLVAAAGEGGTLTLWDMRHTSQPFTCIAAHTAPMLEARFHSGAPDHLFSCGLDGQLVHWDASDTASLRPHKQTGSDPGGLVTAWLRPGVQRGEVCTTALLSAGPLPLNSVDVQVDVLIAASDNEALYVIRNVILY